MTLCAANPDQTTKKSIVIIDDHPVMRRGIAALIEPEPDLRVSGEAASVKESLQLFDEAVPDLAIVDLMLGDDDGLDLVKRFKKRHPEMPSLVLSMQDESIYAERSLRAGARGYLSKQQLDNTVLDAIRTVLDGGIFMSGKVQSLFARKFIGGNNRQDASPLQGLSDRQLQVLRLLGQGRSSKRIAKSLSLSVKTIESHIEHLKQKLQIGSIAELKLCAHDWVSRGDDQLF